MTSLEPKILGGLALMQSVVATLPSTQSMLSFIRQGFRDLPGVASVESTECTTKIHTSLSSSDDSRRQFLIQSHDRVYARIEMVFDSWERFEPYLPYLNNFMMMLGVIFAEREQRDLNEQLVGDLESRVDERTRQLKAEVEERIQTEQTLRWNEKLLHRSMQLGAQGSFLIDDIRQPWKTSSEMNAILGIDQAFPHNVEQFIQLIHPDVREEISTLMGDVLAGRTHSFDHTFKIIRHNDQDTRWIRAIAEAEFDAHNQFLGLRGVLQDITRARENVLQLERSNLELQESLARIQEINRDLEVARRQAEESDRLKSAFLANISHEIRTPMNGILGFADLLQEGGLSSEEQADYLAVIASSGERLLSLINNLIDVSRLEEHQLKLSRTETNITILLEEQVALFKPEAKRRCIDLVIEPSPTPRSLQVSFDRDRIAQVLGNLIRNALRFTANGCITLGGRISGDDIEFTVRDTGRGIPPKARDAIFDRFHQVENSFSRNHEGAGLGLAISKALIELHGGRIWVESQVGVGSTFHFTLPFVSTDTPTPSIDRSEVPRLDLVRRNRVLIVEDDEASFTLLDTILKAKLDITHVRSGREAVNTMLSPNNIELILMDIKLPDMDGFEATRQIKSRYPDLPIIAQTAFSQNEERERAARAGCDAFLTKPIDRRELYDLLQRCL